MTIETNKAVVRRYIEELNRRNLAVLDDVIAAPFRTAVAQSYARSLAAFPDCHVRIEDVIAEGDRVVVAWSYGDPPRGVYEGVSPTGIGRLMIAFVPAGRMEAFFKAVTGRGAMPPQDAALWRAHGMELLGPPLALG